MITRRTKLQLVVFAIITLLGVSYVGARYAQLDRKVVDQTYTVTVHLEQSGGIFAGAEVTYRGVEIGRVKTLTLTEDGVDADLDIEDSWDSIPADTLAVVGNRSAVGEQYIELQPTTDDGPYLANGSEVDADDTRTPLPTQDLLADLATTVGSVDRDALKTTVRELGDAFAGSGRDLQTIIDTSSSFIDTADANFDVTQALIRDANTVLQTQVDSESSIRTFADRLSLFTDVLADDDPQLRQIIDDGSATANQLRTFLEDNKVNLSELINRLVTTGEVVTANLPGLEQILVIYPYLVEGSFGVVTKTQRTGLYDAHFGLILTTKEACRQGYDQSPRSPSDGSNVPMDTKVGCTESSATTNSRGPQNLGRAAPGYDATDVASYDPDTGKLTWGTRQAEALDDRGSVAPPSGKDAWKWLYLQPLVVDQQR